MQVTEALLRALIRESLSRIDETVRDTYGYSVHSADDVRWTPDKRAIPKERNPFVGSSPAYHSWYNDGNQRVRWSKEIEPIVGDPYKIRGSTEVYFNEGNYVIIPSIDASIPGRIMAIYHKEPVGVEGADPTDTIPLANISWSEFGGQGPSTDVGLAFLVKVGTRDPMGSASAAMGFYRSGQDAQAEREERRAEREARREEKRLAAMPPPEPTPAPAPPPRTIRRVGGVAAPPPPPKPMEMTPAELARWKEQMGLRSRE